MKMGRDEIKKHCSTGLQSDQNQLDAQGTLRPPLAPPTVTEQPIDFAQILIRIRSTSSCKRIFDSIFLSPIFCSRTEM